MKAIQVRRAGTDVVIGETKKFNRPMLVPAGVSYDIVLVQTSGSGELKPGIVARRGELIEIR